jgi:hypothetical protein
MSDASTSVSAEPQWAAWVAIDWANQNNFWRLLPAGAQRAEEGELENTPEAVERWAAALEQRFGGRPIAVCLEQSRRKTFAPSGAKSDASDTAGLLDLLLRHREQLRQMQPDTNETRLLQLYLFTSLRNLGQPTEDFAGQKARLRVP